MPSDWNEHLAGENPLPIRPFGKDAASQAAMDALLRALQLEGHAQEETLIRRLKRRARYPFIMAAAVIGGLLLLIGFLMMSLRP
jgi:ABC-type Fe3+-siderophore transport system permease subunit